MGKAWTGAGSLNHLTIYSPVILSYEVEAPVNTVGGAILSVHLLAIVPQHVNGIWLGLCVEIVGCRKAPF